MKLSAAVLTCALLLAAEAVGMHWYDTHRQSPRTSGGASEQAPVVERHAPEGTLYLLRYASTRTPKGIYGFEPGCEVHLVKTSADRLTALVSDGRQQIEVDASMLTRDPDLAERAHREDQTLQAAVAAYWERQRQDYAAAHRQIFIAHAQSVHAAELARVRGAAIGGSGSTLDQPPAPMPLTELATPSPAAPSPAAPVSPGVASQSTTDPDALASDPDYQKLMNFSKLGK